MIGEGGEVNSAKYYANSNTLGTLRLFYRRVLPPHRFANFKAVFRNVPVCDRCYCPSASRKPSASGTCSKASIYCGGVVGRLASPRKKHSVNELHPLSVNETQLLASPPSRLQLAVSDTFLSSSSLQPS